MDLPIVLVSEQENYVDAAVELITAALDLCTQRADELGTIRDGVRPIIPSLRDMTAQMVRLTLMLAPTREEQEAAFKELIDHMSNIFGDMGLVAYLDGTTIIMSLKED